MNHGYFSRDHNVIIAKIPVSFYTGFSHELLNAVHRRVFRSDGAIAEDGQFSGTNTLFRFSSDSPRRVHVLTKMRTTDKTGPDREKTIGLFMRKAAMGKLQRPLILCTDASGSSRKPFVRLVLLLSPCHRFSTRNENILAENGTRCNQRRWLQEKRYL